jgi:hypothetical protein
MTTAAIKPAPEVFIDAEAPALSQAAQFIRAQILRLSLISAAALIPVFWHRHIESSDLGSHLYNVWLAQLIRHGQAPGLYFTPQWTNTLFDHILGGLVGAFGFRAGERIAVSLAVLIFFWGSFALAAAAARRAPWFVLPAIAMFTYGWTFELGFFNYYLSLGISFWCLALFWRGAGWERILALALTPLILMGHPLGVVWFLGAAACILMAENLPRRYHILLLLAGGAVIFFVSRYLGQHFVVEAESVSLVFSNGSDQLDLFSGRYYKLQNVLLVIVTLALLVDVMQRKRDRSVVSVYRIPLALYILVELSVYLIPDGIRVPNHAAALAMLTSRLTSISAVLICCLLAAMRPRKGHLAGLSAIAAVFFVFLYQDTGAINRMEDQAERVVKTLPPNQRVLATILPPGDSRVLIQHIVDRACIGHCFSYGNYEPASEVFRIRVRPGNPYNLSSMDDVGAMEEGTYTVRAEDLPAYQIYQCGGKGTVLCIRPLEEDEDNNAVGTPPK